MNRDKLYQQVIEAILIALLLVGCGAPAATHTHPTNGHTTPAHIHTSLTTATPTLKPPTPKPTSTYTPEPTSTITPIPTSTMIDWQNRPVYQKITRDIIAVIPDELLAWAMFDHIWFKVGDDYERTLQVLAGLPPGFSVVYHLFTLDGEIGNGGFNQYFFNGLDKDAEQQLAALNLIEATKHIRVFQEAFRIRDKEKQNEELQRQYAEGTIESFFSTYGMTMLEKCDEEWFALNNEFDALLIHFIRKHPELFLTEE